MCCITFPSDSPSQTVKLIEDRGLLLLPERWILVEESGLGHVGWSLEYVPVVEERANKYGTRK